MGGEDYAREKVQRLRRELGVLQEKSRSLDGSLRLQNKKKDDLMQMLDDITKRISKLDGEKYKNLLEQKGIRAKLEALAEQGIAVDVEPGNERAGGAAGKLREPLPYGKEGTSAVDENGDDLPPGFGEGPRPQSQGYDREDYSQSVAKSSFMPRSVRLNAGSPTAAPPGYDAPAYVGAMSPPPGFDSPPPGFEAAAKPVSQGPVDLRNVLNARRAAAAGVAPSAEDVRPPGFGSPPPGFRLSEAPASMRADRQEPESENDTMTGASGDSGGSSMDDEPAGGKDSIREPRDASGHAQRTAGVPPTAPSYSTWARRSASPATAVTRGAGRGLPDEDDPFGGVEPDQAPRSTGSGRPERPLWGRPAARRNHDDEGVRDIGQPPALPSPKQTEELRSEDFPSLGGPAPAAAAGKPAGAWGAGAAHLLSAAVAEKPASKGPAAGPLPPGMSWENYEVGAALRAPNDLSADLERRRQMRSDKQLEHYERVNGRQTNIVEGLEVHDNVLSPAEQAMMVDKIDAWVAQGRSNDLRGRTFSAPRKWLKGKGRITVQFGCCYNYAKDSQGRPPGIIPDEVVEPMPPVLVALCKRLVRWKVLPAEKEPDSAIVNIYEEGDCIPPHIDHHDFVRPFCTLSLLSKQCIMFASKITPLGPGQFDADYKLPLTPGSCLVLKGNGADVAQHCVPPVSSRRMSITLRKMGPRFADNVKRIAERELTRPPSRTLGRKLLAADDADSDEDGDFARRNNSWYGTARRRSDPW